MELAWRVATGGAKGAQHGIDGLPYQDAAAAARAGDCIALAVADGHGHARHYRSDRGARLAADIACDVGARAGAALPASADAKAIDAVVGEALVDELLLCWRDAVGADVAADPVDDPDPLVAYGSTLALVVLADPWVIGVQIGDGDIVGIGPEGEAVPVVAPALRLDGSLTNSLCEQDAAAAFRCAAVDTRETPLVAVLLATDGYGNAQVDDPWQPGVAADLARLLNEQGGEWVAGELAAWAGRCASSEGSGDDVTLALAYRQAGAL